MTFRLFCLLASLLLSGSAFAIGLGELNNQSALGDRLQLEINILGATSKEGLDAACYKLKQPSGGDDIPWLKTANLSVRKGAQPVLEIRSSQMLHDPILAVAVSMNCGQEIVREYIVLASPAREISPPQVLPSNPNPAVVSPKPGAVVPSQAKTKPDRLPLQRAHPQRPPAPRLSVAAGAMSDRLTLSAGIEVGDPSLRLSSELSTLATRSAEMTEVQREMLRLEFRMLLALQEQALTQLEASEKLRNLDKALGELHKNAAEVNVKEVMPQPAAVPALPVPPPVVSPALPDNSSLIDEWGLYALLLLVFVGVAAWLAWRNIQVRRARRLVLDDYPETPVPPAVEPVMTESAALDAVDIPMEPVAAGEVMHVDFPLDADAQAGAGIYLSEMPFSPPADHGLESATVDERFEANPVMELADIMLSFGRVKGAAQALQEYIDANPQEAVQPWVRLLDVYRMAGMRSEFETLALNLNKNFNIEIQHWDLPPAVDAPNTVDFVLDDALPAVVSATRAESIEDMPRILQQVIERWPGDGVGKYLQELLRDNRGGARVGLSLQVVEEMLFLIDLKEMVIKMEKEG